MRASLIRRFLAEAGDFLQRLVALGLQADAPIDAVGRPTAGESHGELGECDDAQNGRADVRRPGLGQWNSGLPDFIAPLEPGERGNFKISNEFA